MQLLTCDLIKELDGSIKLLGALGHNGTSIKKLSDKVPSKQEIGSIKYTHSTRSQGLNAAQRYTAQSDP